MAKARADDKPLVYIGFGSITVPNLPAMTRSIIKAVLKSKSRLVTPYTPLFRRPALFKLAGENDWLTDVTA